MYADPPLLTGCLAFSFRSSCLGSSARTSTCRGAATLKAGVRANLPRAPGCASKLGLLVHAGAMVLDI